MYELETGEWVIAEDRVTVLLVSILYLGYSCFINLLWQYKNATLFFSQESASVAAVIPAMDRITNQLNHQTGKAYHPPLAAAMKLARKKMDRQRSIPS